MSEKMVEGDMDDEQKKELDRMRWEK